MSLRPFVVHRQDCLSLVLRRKGAQKIQALLRRPERWKEYYPEEVSWYRLVICENKEGRSSNRFRALAIDSATLINADLNKGTRANTWYNEEPVIELLPLLVEAARRSMDLLKNGTYNDFVAKNLPYQHRIGVLKRSDEWKVDPDAKNAYWKDMDEETYRAFQSYLPTNAENKIGRLKSFTANDFFRACYLGYKACGYPLGDKTPEQAYLRYADGRDEGLTGTGFGLNEGPGSTTTALPRGLNGTTAPAEAAIRGRSSEAEIPRM